MDNFDYVGLGNTARDVWLKKLIDELNAKIEQAVDAAFSLSVVEGSDGTLIFSLLNHDNEVLSIGTVDLTTKIIKSAEVDYDHKVINFTCLDDSIISCDIEELLDTLANKVDKISGKGLSKNDFTDSLKAKLEQIGVDAQANVIENVQVDGVDLPVENKTVNIDLSGKVDKEPGKGLSTHDYTTPEKNKLAGIESGAQVNIIENVKVDGHNLVITDKSVNIDLSDKVDKVNGKGLSTNDFTNAYMDKIDNIQAGAQVNTLEVVKVNGTPLVNTDKAVNIDLTGKVDKVAGKELSTNDFTDTYKEQLDNLDTVLDTKVDKVAGKGLSEDDFTTSEKNKLAGIEESAQRNIIETIKIDNIPLVPSQKTVNITLSDKLDKTLYFNKIYGTDSEGQALYNFDTNEGDLTSQNIVRRFTGGSITVPVNPTDSNDATSKQYVDTFAKNIELTIDNSSYIINATLKDNNGNVLASRSIDLPIETSLVSISYDAPNKSLVYVTKGGSSSSISIADVISGLQTEITPTNKLPSYLVDDTGSVDHSFISVAEKQQIAANTAAIENKANANDVYNITTVEALLSTKQNVLPAQPAFVSKGSATKIPQITTNALGQVTNISEILFDGMPLSTRYGADVHLTLDSNTYILTSELIDQTGQILGTPKQVVLPLESMVVDASYDPSTQTITLTLNNGHSLTISLVDLVDGLVPTTRTISGITLENNITTDALLATFFDVTDVIIEDEE